MMTILEGSDGKNGLEIHLFSKHLQFLDVREAGEFGEGHPLFAMPCPYSRLEARIAALPPGSLDGTRVGRDRFLDMIEGMAFGEDPRQGRAVQL